MKTTPLGNLATVMTGGTPDRGTPAYWGGSIPWVGTGEIDFNVIESPTEYLTERGLKESAARLLPKGTLLMAMYGQGTTRGKVGILAIEAASNQACAAIVPKAGLTESEFLFYVLEASYTRIRRLSNTGSQENLNTTLIREIPIPVLTKAARDEIVLVARQWNAAIEKTTALLAALEQRKKGLMQQLLTGRRRLKGFKGKWKPYRLEELFEERNEANHPDLPLLSITRDEGVVRRDTTGRKDTSNEDKSAYLRICPGDIGYNTMRMWQGVSALSSLEGIISPAYTVCVPNERSNSRFMAHLFKLPLVVNLFYRYSQGLTSDTWNLKFRHFSEVKVEVPAPDEQKAIAEVLDTQHAELLVLRCQLGQLNAQKRALMQKLLSGNWRMPKTALLKEFSA
jgi:type I restriction enzyme, S subunit